MRVSFLLIVLASAVWPAFADNICDEPIFDWQPRETLQMRLEHDGLKVKSIIAQSGCYEVVTIDSSGAVIAVTFNPRTLVQVGTQHALTHS